MFYRIILYCVFLSCLGTGLTTSPHIVFIVADDLGWNDVGWHNPDMQTPNLDKLARAGVILNSSYVQPLCTPSRNAFMSGYYPYHTGLQHLVVKNNAAKFLPSNFTLLPQKLKEIGYATHMVGKWHLGHCDWKYTPTFRGFDSFLGFYGVAQDYYTHMTYKNGYDFRNNTEIYYPPTGEYSVHTYTARAVDIISSHDPAHQPLYLYLPFQSVHFPTMVPKKYEDMYSYIKDDSRRIYSGMVSALDEAVGNITNALEIHGFMNNTLIVFTTDNGGQPKYGGNNMPLRGSKATLWEGGTRGAAFVYSETLLNKTGYVNTGLMHAVDWFPTLLSVAGGDSVKGIDGVDVWQTLSKNATSPRTEFIYNIDELKGNAAIRMGDYKLIQGVPGGMNDWYSIPTYTGRTNESADIVKHDIGDVLKKRTKTDNYMLFDIKNDPTEHFDVADKHVDLVEMMKQRLAYYRQTLVPAQNPPPDPASNPANYGGTVSPGWC